MGLGEDLYVLDESVVYLGLVKGRCISNNEREFRVGY
jgi:hypothetical protein